MRDKSQVKHYIRQRTVCYLLTCEPN